MSGNFQVVNEEFDINFEIQGTVVAIIVNGCTILTEMKRE